MSSSSSSVSEPRSVPVTKMAEIRRGEHISWPAETDNSVNHHAIVVEDPDTEKGILTVIHWYSDTASSVSSSGLDSTIREDNVYYLVKDRIGQGKVHRYEHQVSYKADEVVSGDEGSE